MRSGVQVLKGSAWCGMLVGARPRHAGAQAEGNSGCKAAPVCKAKLARHVRRFAAKNALLIVQHEMPCCPPLRRLKLADLVELTGRLSSLPGVKAVGLTSNGLTLGRKLAALKDAGGTAAQLV